MKKIIVIAGPTASGKTALAIKLAQEIDGEVINADSLQVYKENPIISAQPTILEQENIPHHLFGYINGNEEYTVARWVEDVKNKINSMKKTPIIVGGSGFYLKHLIFGLSAIPDIPEDLRIEARQLHSKLGNFEFYNLLKQIDAITAAKLNFNDYKRVLRAYEVMVTTGKPIYFWQEKNIKHFSTSSFLTIVLQPSRESLYENCNKRFLNMLEMGALKEVEYLLNQGYNPSQGIMKSHGVPELIRYLNGEWNLNEATLKSQQVVRNYAKRQTTWFRHQFNDPELKLHFIQKPDINHIKSFLKIF